jgi:uroporphyrin-III C-methyltransferase
MLPLPPHVSRSAQPGTVYLVGAGPGAADLLTIRALRLLQTADVVVHDSLVQPEIYAHLDARCIDVGKRSGDHGLGQTGIHTLLVDLARQQQSVVRLKGGDPYVLGRGSEEALAMAAAGVPCEVVPGVSSALAAPLLAGIPLTHRGLAESFCVVSAHPQPTGQSAAIPPFEPRRTLVLLMGVHTLPNWLPQLRALGYPGDLEVAFVMHASWPQGRVQAATLATCEAILIENPVTAPAVAVIGRVVALLGQLPQDLS